MWIIEQDAEADIASDLSAFHRVDDPMTLEPERYFSLAQRLVAYNGVLRRLAQYRADRDNEGGSGAHSGAERHAKVSDDVAIAQLGDWADHTKGDAA